MALIPSTDPRLRAEQEEEAKYREYLEEVKYQEYLAKQNAPGTQVQLIPSQSPTGKEEEAAWQQYNLERDTSRELREDTNAFLVGAGREFTQLGRGTGQMFDIFRSALADSPKQRALVQKSKDERQQLQEMEKPIYETLRGEAPVKTFLGEMAPYALAPLGPTAGARRKLAAQQAAEAEAAVLGYEIPKLGQMEALTTKALASPAATGAAEGAVVGTIHPEMDPVTGALGGYAGGKLGQYAGRMFSSPYKHPSHNARQILGWADQHGFFTPPGLATGRGTLQQIDSAIASQRKTAAEYEDVLKESSSKLNKLITDKVTSVGPDGRIQKHGVYEISEDWINEHTTRIGKEMEDLVGSTRFEPRQTAMNAEKHLQEALDHTKSGVLPIVKKKIARLKEIIELGGTVDGAEYQAISRSIKDGVDDLYSEGSGKAARSLRKILDDMEVDIEASGLSDPNTLNRWKKARKDYAIVSAIQDAFTKNRHSTLPAWQGFIDYTALGKRLGKMDPDFDMVRRYSDAMNKQVKASLSTSGEFSKTFNPFSTDVRAGPALRLAGKTLDKIPFIGDESHRLATRVYLSGWPYKRGMLGIKSPIMQQGIESLLTRMGIGVGEKDDD